MRVHGREYYRSRQERQAERIDTALQCRSLHSRAQAIKVERGLNDHILDVLAVCATAMNARL